MITNLLASFEKYTETGILPFDTLVKHRIGLYTVEEFDFAEINYMLCFLVTS